MPQFGQSIYRHVVAEEFSWVFSGSPTALHERERGRIVGTGRRAGGKERAELARRSLLVKILAGVAAVVVLGGAFVAYQVTHRGPPQRRLSLTAPARRQRWPRHDVAPDPRRWRARRHRPRGRAGLLPPDGHGPRGQGEGRGGSGRSGAASGVRARFGDRAERH